MKNIIFQQVLPSNIRGKFLSEFNRLALQRSIQYTVHIKMFGTNGKGSIPKLKSHAFCCPHNGADIISDSLVINKGCLQNFTMSFIGDEKMFKLMSSTNKITHHRVDCELSFKLLNYLKNAGHPLYAKIVLPELSVFSNDLNNLSKTAFDNIIINDEAVTQIMENKMENQEEGFSGLFSSTISSETNEDTLNGIYEMVNKSRRKKSLEVDGQENNLDYQNSNIVETTDVSKRSETQAHSISDSEQQPNSISIESNLLNEYEENHIIYGGTFPFEFTLGVPSRFSKGHFPYHLLNRLLKAHTSDFESCHNFIFLSFNQLQRHASSRTVSYSSKSSGQYMQKLASTLKESNFDKN